MMGTKLRIFALLTDLSLDRLVPRDHFYRRLDRVLDLAFVRDLVVDCYAAGGRPSVDPVVFFKLQLVMFFEDIRSERQLLAVAADRLSVRWYLGYDLSEQLPDHSSLTRIRDRYGLEIFRRFFDAVVVQCQQAGLVWGREFYLDATKVEANASLDSVAPRFAVDAHLEQLFASETVSTDVDATSAQSAPVSFPAPADTVVAEANATRHDWLARDGRPDRAVTRAHYERLSNYRASRTDPDATLMTRRGGGAHFGYHTHYVVDGGKARVILQALVTPADVTENLPMRDLVWRSRFRWKLHPHQVTGDTTYGTADNVVALEDQGIHAYVPLRDFDTRTARFSDKDFRYDRERDAYRCPQGEWLTFNHHAYALRQTRYRAKPAICNACPIKTRCTTGKQGREVIRSFDEEYLERVRGYHTTEAYQKAYRKRQVWVEPLFAEGKQWHRLRRFRLRGLTKVNGEALLIASGQNLKRLLQRHGGGRRPWPGCAADIVVGFTPTHS